MPILSSPLPRRWFFLAFLALLHLVFVQGPESGLGRLLFLTHIGIGLLWQPFVHPGRKVGFGGTALVVCWSALLALYLGWPLLVLWLLLLCGVAGGKVFLFPDRWERLFHLFALGYLAIMLLAFAIPQVLVERGHGDVDVEQIALWLGPAILFAMAMLPGERVQREDRAEVIDYVYGVLVFLLLATIALGSVSLSLLLAVGYFESLMATLGAVAGLLLLLGFIWSPRSGFGGLGSAVARHIASLGLPIEGWLESLARLSRDEDNPHTFLLRACAELPPRLPGVVGGSWRTPDGEGTFGEPAGERVVFEYEQLRLELFCRVAPSPGLRWHYDLTARLLAEFYMDKWRATELQRLAYAEAIHETGARLTHDVKNLLQSLDTLCAAAAQETDSPSPRFGALMRRQLPELAERLRQTLAKLNAPRQASSAGVVAVRAEDWVATLAGRHPGNWLAVDRQCPPDAWIDDAELFSSVADNLLQNVVDKRRDAPQVGGRCRLVVDGDGLALTVEDDGAEIPAELAARITRGRVTSGRGLGIGLYQSARLAAGRGWRLALEENRPGCVRFALRRAHRSPETGAR